MVGNVKILDVDLQRLYFGLSMISQNVLWQSSDVKREDRQRLNGHSGAILWLTGLSGAGKSTLAHAVEKRLFSMGVQTYVLDGDNIRHGLCGDLGFSTADRAENIRRISEVAKLFMDAGFIVLTAFISPYTAEREKAKLLIGNDNFLEIYCRCPLPVCEKRDVKGLYKKARAGEVKEFTGVSSSYEEPIAADLIIDTADLSVEDSADSIIDLLLKRKIFPHTFTIKN